MNHSNLHQKSFYILLSIVTIGFFWILYPFFGSVFWAAILGLIFHPIQEWITYFLRGRKNAAAFITLLLIMLIVILPLILIGVTLVQEVSLIYQRIKNGDVDFGVFYQNIFHALPGILQRMLARLELGNISAFQEHLAEGASHISQYLATQAFNLGQNTFQFIISFSVMIYVMFFLLRDGREIGEKIYHVIPLDEEHKIFLLRKFTTVISATVKGNIVVAVIQGLLGGVIFAAFGIQGSLLWGVLIAFLSLLPVIGSAFIWGPVALFFLMTGQIWKGIILILFFLFVIGLIDNILRPILVGKDTKLPDWIVLIATLGGIGLFGIEGFIIGPLIAALFIASWTLFPKREPKRAEFSFSNTNTEK